MKYFEIRLLKNRLVIMMFIAILTVMSCEMGMLFGNCDFVSLLKWQFGGYTYDFSLKGEIPMNYLIFVMQLLMTVGVTSLSEIRASKSNLNTIIFYGRRKYWMKRSVFLIIQVIISMMIIIISTAIYTLCHNMSLGTDEFASVMQGIGLNVFPMCVISLQAILTLQLVCMNPVIVVFLYEAVMIVPLSMADKHWIMDTMFLYRAGILENKYYVSFGLVYILVLIILFLVGVGIIDKKEI